MGIKESNELSDREIEILEKVVSEYVKSAKPISSKYLEARYDFKISPATIRGEMHELTKKGYLLQPHTSAGRVPTDKGYRFFVNYKNKENEIINELGKAEKIIENQSNIFFVLDAVSRFLAETSHNFAITGLLNQGFFSKDGWKHILQEPEFDDNEISLEFANFISNFEKEIENLNMDSEAIIYIGSENPVDESSNFSIIIARCNFPQEQTGFISILGPKRMSYHRNICIINSITALLSEL